MRTSRTQASDDPRPLSRRTGLLAVSLLATFVCLRGYLHVSPNTDLNVGPYNIHHLYVGVIAIMFCGIPLAVFRGPDRFLDAAAIGFGIGLSMALDEWAYLIATDGSNASYLLPASFWGGAMMVGLACIYTLAIFLVGSKNHKVSLQPDPTERSSLAPRPGPSGRGSM